MSRWFRFYDDAINDPKILKLSDELHRVWIGLLCIASKNNGRLPPMEDVALMIRMKPHKAGEAVAKLIKAGLIDEDGGDFLPHNWDKRQYKSDVTDPTNAERQKRYRDRHRVTQNAVTPKRPEAEYRIQKVDDADDARGGLVRSAAFRLSDEIAVMCGHDPQFVPPAWCGAPMRVEMWLGQGWSREHILPAIKAALEKKRGPPPNSINYFEKPIAEFIAQASRPLPEVVIDNTPEQIHVRPQAVNSASAAADRLLERLRSFDIPSPPGEISRRGRLGEITAEGDAGIRDRAGEAPPRLLSQG